MICRYCAYSGEPWTDALENELTFSRVFARFKFWNANPPQIVLLEMLAMFVGYEPPRKKAPLQDLSALRAMFPSGKITG